MQSHVRERRGRWAGGGVLEGLLLAGGVVPPMVIVVAVAWLLPVAVRTRGPLRGMPVSIVVHGTGFETEPAIAGGGAAMQRPCA